MRGGRTEERGGRGRGRVVEQGGVPAPSSRGRGAEERGGEEEETEDRGQGGLAEDIMGGGNSGADWRDFKTPPQTLATPPATEHIR